MTEFVANGTDFTGGPPPTGWTSGAGNTVEESSGRLRIIYVEGSIGFGLYTVTGLTSGETYSFCVDGFLGTGSDWRAAVANVAFTEIWYDSGTRTSDGNIMTTFTPTATSGVVFLSYTTAIAPNDYVEFDNVSITDNPAIGVCGSHRMTRNQRYRRILLPQTSEIF